MSPPSPAAGPAIRPVTLPIPERIDGARIVLRPYDLSDAPALQAAVVRSREHLAPWMSWARDGYRSVEDALEFCARSRAGWYLRERDITLGIFARHGGRLLGGTGLHRIDWRAGRFEIGYWLAVDALGHGYTTEAVCLLTRLAYDVLGANRVEVRCDAHNVRSAAVARRAGFVHEGTLRRDTLNLAGALRDTLVFGMLREEYDAARPSWSRYLDGGA